jgi:hypothetical protein
MKHNYDIEIKPVSGGRKKVTVKLDGTVIGVRSSARIYRFLLVVTGNQAHALQAAKNGVDYHRKQVEKYQAIVDDAPGARNNFIMFYEGKVLSMESQQWHRDYIANGNIAKWIATEKERLAACEAKVVKLSSGPLPEFNQPTVASWHQQRKNVPSPREWSLFYDIIEIPVSEQIEAVDSQVNTSMTFTTDITGEVIGV